MRTHLPLPRCYTIGKSYIIYGYTKSPTAQDMYADTCFVSAGPEFVELDGDSLKIDDVIKISKRKCDVKVYNTSSTSSLHFNVLHIIILYSCLEVLWKRSTPQEKLLTKLSKLVQVG